MADQNKPRKDPTAVDDTKLRLYGPAIRPDGRQTMLRMKKSENNPVLEADLGIKTEGRNGKEGYPIKIETPMAPRPFKTLMNLIKNVAKSKVPCEFEMDNWGHPFMWDKDAGKNVRSKDRMIISRFQISKREDGVVTFGVTAKGKEDVTFEFKDDEFHPITQNGQPVDVKISSALSAIAWAEALSEVYFTHYTVNWQEPEFQKRRRLENMQNAQGRGQGGGGNYQNRNNGGGGNNYQNNQQQQQRPAPSAPAAAMDDNGFDDDIPF
jgi:hypothetical protein